MDNFVFSNPTRIIFGKGVESEIGMEAGKVSKRVLLHFGSGSAERSGLLAKVRESLAKSGVEVIELGGVQPNPRVSLVREGLALCRSARVSFIVAVGGGSVIDSAKAIAVGVPYAGDVWDFYDWKSVPDRALGVGVVLTIPASGSESSNSSVISNADRELKRGLNSEMIRPVFALMNPELTYTLSPFQTACGAADIMAHVMERYFTNTRDTDLTDRLCEAVLRSVIAQAPVALAKPSDYAARAEILWAGSQAHNGLLGTGREGDWASHAIEHELSALYDVAHGAGLAAVFPAWMKAVFRHDVARFAQFATRVWGVEEDFRDPEKTALEGIARMEAFFRSIGLAVRLPGLGIPTDRFGEMSEKAVLKGHGFTGAFVKLDAAAVREILEIASKP